MNVLRHQTGRDATKEATKMTATNSRRTKYVTRKDAETFIAMQQREARGVVQPLPQKGETPSHYHEEHVRVGSATDGRCLLCYPLPNETALCESG